MRKLTRFLLTASLTAAIAASASAQGGGGGQGGGGQGGGGGTNQTGTGDVGGLPFGANGNVGVQTMSMTTVSNSVTNAQNNVLGGFYANPMFQGKIGTYGNTSPGGFGQALYNTTGTSGGMTGANGARTSNTGFGGSNGATGGRGGGGGASTTGFGGTSSGSTGFGGTSTGSTGFGGTGQTGGGRAGGAASGFGGGIGGGTGGFGGATGGQGGFGGGGLGGGRGGFGGQMGGGQQATNVIAADRPVNAYFRTGPNANGAFGPANPAITPVTVQAQTDLRGIFDRTTTISAGKSLEIQVTTDGIARLRGTVANDDEKRMAVGLAQTTPGVRQVVSELKVQNP